MKADKDHSVPLTGAAMAVLDKMAESKDGKFIFPGMTAGKPLSNMAMLALLRRMGHGKLTVHGFRSTFRDWAAEQTNFASEICEMALAHTAGDKVKEAYMRTDLIDKRRLLAAQWADYCNTLPEERGTVVPLHGVQTA
jgi:integrase